MADGRSVLTGILRGARLRCPNCNQGKLYWRYLKVRPGCEVCGHNLAAYPADDAPPYFTIFLVGHLVIGPMLVFGFIETWPVQWVLLTTLPALTILTLVLLPIVKGGTIGGCWALGFKRDDIGEAAPAPKQP